MRERWGRWMFRSAAAAVFACLVGMALGPVGSAEAKTGSAEVKKITGQVEVQRKGEAQWSPVVVGAKLVEGDSIRAWGGASARMDLPDGSTIFLAENSRVVVGKLDFDQQDQAREALFHLAVGKIRAVVSQTALRLVKSPPVQFLDLDPDRRGGRPGNGFRGHLRRPQAGDAHRRPARVRPRAEGRRRLGPVAGGGAGHGWTSTDGAAAGDGRRRPRPYFSRTAVAGAQMRVGTAVVKTVTGRAEVQRKDDAQWIATAPGARLAEGDNIRAHAASSAVLDLPDGSTLFVAENSRIVVSKLEFDPQSQARQSFVHLAVGKVRAVVSQAAVTLVKARQSNFAVTTPTAVAAARGTVFEVVYDATQNVMRVAVIVKDPQRAAGLVSCLSLYDRFSSVLVREGLATSASGTSGCTPPVPISMLPDANLVGTLQNPIRPGPAFSVPVTVPSVPSSSTPAPVAFTSDPGDAPAAPPSTIGVNIGNLPPPQSTSSNPAVQ